MTIFINPGSGQISGLCTKANAVSNIRALIADIDMPSPAVTRSTSPKPDGSGRWSFVLCRGKAKCRIDMPGLPLDAIRYRTDCPRLYIEGSSFWWKYVVELARLELMDHDGKIARDIAAAERKVKQVWKTNPWCKCGSALDVESIDCPNGKEKLRIRCYSCEPEVSENMESMDGRTTYTVLGRPTDRPYRVVKRARIPPADPNSSCHNGSGYDRCRLAYGHNGKCDPLWLVIDVKVIDPTAPGTLRVTK